MASLDTAIRLVTQAVHQDSAKNFEEAARCYREAIVVFRNLQRSNSVSGAVERVIHEKCDLYEQRLRKIESHLFNQADLSKLFRHCMPQDLDLIHQSEVGSGTIDHLATLRANPYLREGLSSIDRGRQEDLQTRFLEALYFYEQGAGLLLNALRKRKVIHKDQNDAVRARLLELHERCDIIQQHLECGDPITLLRQPGHSLNSSVVSNPEFESHIPSQSEEDQALLMEEIHSMAGSTHSLYPTCVEIKRSPSLISGHSDYALNSNPHLLIHENEEMEHKSLIPLADLDRDLQLSALSIGSKMLGQLGERQKSHHSSLTGSLDNINSSCSVSPTLRSASSSGRASCIELARENEPLLGSSCSQEDGDFPTYAVERDRNISELTCMNAEIDVALLKEYSDSGSDSGYSDPRPDSAQMQTKSPTGFMGRKSPALDRQSPLSDIDSLDIVPSLPLASPSPEQSQSSSPTPSSGSRRSRRSRDSKGSGSSIRLDKGEEKVTVLSEETVVDGQPLVVATVPEVYSKSNAERQEVIPSRATARQYQEREENNVNQGCYYLVACLDSLWVL